MKEEWCLLGCYAVKTSNLTGMKEFIKQINLNNVESKTTQSENKK
jgi:hypothetical protein